MLKQLLSLIENLTLRVDALEYKMKQQKDNSK